MASTAATWTSVPRARPSVFPRIPIVVVWPAGLNIDALLSTRRVFSSRASSIRTSPHDFDVKGTKRKKIEEVGKEVASSTKKKQDV